MRPTLFLSAASNKDITDNIRDVIFKEDNTFNKVQKQTNFYFIWNKTTIELSSTQYLWPCPSFLSSLT